MAFTLFGIAADKLDGVARLMLAEMWLESRGTNREGSHALLHYCVPFLLLPAGSNRDRAVRQREAILASYPDLRAEFESMAADYVRERIAAGSAASPK